MTHLPTKSNIKYLLHLKLFIQNIHNFFHTKLDWLHSTVSTHTYEHFSPSNQQVKQALSPGTECH